MTDKSPSAASEPSFCPAQRPSLTPQRLQEKGPNDTLVLNSPYGPTRNITYGWGSLFKPPMSAVIAGHPHIHIGISSLNGVPTVGKSDRSMRSLLMQYRKKFNCLEHCYPYHRVGDAATWKSWAEMVRDSDTINLESIKALPSDSTPSSSRAVLQTTGGSIAAAASSAADAPALSLHTLTVNAARFMYTIKANNLLTHAKQLQMRDSEVQEHVSTFFHQRCPLLEPFLGPVLVQLPPSFRYSQVHVERLSELYEQLTREEMTLKEVMATTAVQTSVSSRDLLTCQLRQQRRIRIAVEFRHSSWYRQETFDLLRSFRWALVAAHHHDDPTFSSVVDTGADFLYLRLHGPLGRSVGDYGSLAMKLWAEEILHYLHPTGATTEEQKEVFVFLNNSDSNVGGTTSSTVDATCLAEHLRARLHSICDPLSSPSNKASALGAPTQPTSVAELAAASAVVQSARAPTAASVVSGGERGECWEEKEAPPAKRPRTATQSGSGRDDEVIID
ncbi:hypothetical protein ABL78_2301 [Leptomonas seymouri]|uniref:Uncharacterized protein n=1 Tax=Leptomonas seymouri TaxID=5684 RepID=A0A0N1ILN3_LEPSE|nr:hypothetical protein ABL78_2301 [Leptomonas seymouri]|eukprot:KPI88568.1 hypothetical protein ABL78_2301 [Leptomonas seymouri]